ncbi:MAG: hypothetical protein QXD03_00485 [Candidatus Anstonellales archaeon]
MAKFEIVARYFGIEHRHEIEAKSKAHALNILYGRLGSKNGLSRDMIKILEVKMHG